MAKFRLSDHNLEIEKGRHTKPKIDPQNKICKMCNLSRVEDEVHFLTESDQYKSERASRFKDMKQLHFNLNTDLKNETFKNLMICDQKQVNIRLAKFIYEGFQNRDIHSSNSDKTVLLNNCLKLIRNCKTLY